MTSAPALPPESHFDLDALEAYLNDPTDWWHKKIWPDYSDVEDESDLLSKTLRIGGRGEEFVPCVGP